MLDYRLFFNPHSLDFADPELRPRLGRANRRIYRLTVRRPASRRAHGR